MCAITKVAFTAPPWEYLANFEPGDRENVEVAVRRQGLCE